MQFFNPEIPLKHKKPAHHPWDKRIKSIHAKTYKYGHNSVKNPIFPQKKEKVYKDNRTKFTVIGNRTSEDFIYCSHLVKGLHKYRQNEFEAPVIRAVSGVEWPKVLADLKRAYGGMAYAITSDAAVLINNKILGDREDLKNYVDVRYIYHLTLDYEKEGIKQFSNYIKTSGRPCAYLQISVDQKCVGTLIFMLYSDIVPLTCENFLNLCDARKGGYTGTPVHRIVKDGWIQCGGFGLKNDQTCLECENFQVPHDRRGVLCMANDGRHHDCSTQFFVLLQPAPWMACKYVAFGQLIEGEGTLEHIESVPTWYESPNAEIIIYKAGTFNMECHRIPITKHLHTYLQGHKENLIAIGEMFYEELLQKVFMAVQLDYLKQLEALRVANEGEGDMDTETYIKQREELRKQLAEVQEDNRPGPSATVPSARSDQSDDTTVNNDFDVDTYHYEQEEYSYKHVTVEETPTVEVEPEKIFYIPFTDVPYPGDADSTYEFKKMIKGDYCHAIDIPKLTDEEKKKKRLSIPFDALSFLFESFKPSDDETDTSLDSEDEKIVRDYLQQNTDRASFAGRMVKKMAHKRQKYDIFDHEKSKDKNKIRTDEEMRVLRVATREYMETRAKKVSINLSAGKLAPTKIKRRQTGFIRPTDLHKIHALIRMSSSNIGGLDYDEDAEVMDHDDDEDDDDDDDEDLDSDSLNLHEDEKRDELFRKVAKAPTSLAKRYGPSQHMSFAPRSDQNIQEGGRQTTALSRLFEEMIHHDDDEIPTLKEYRPHVEGEQKSYLFLSNRRISSDTSSREKFFQPQIPRGSIDHVLDLQHGKQFRKISSDYVRTIDTLEQTMPHSIRTVEFSKKRPSISIQQYKLRNQQYQELMQAKAALEEQPITCKKLRLPGDSPIHEACINPEKAHW